MFSSAALLQNAIAQKEALSKSFLLGDTTYKLILGDRFLLSVIITLDINHKIRPVAFIVSEFDDEEAWEFGLYVLKDILDFIEKYINPESTGYDLDYFISDGAPQIYNAR